jgi:hypothetical protein
MPVLLEFWRCWFDIKSVWGDTVDFVIAILQTNKQCGRTVLKSVHAHDAAHEVVYVVSATFFPEPQTGS